MNGVNVGNTQYIDAFQRAQFWSLVGGTPYHLILSPSTLSAQSLTFYGKGVAGSSGAGANYNVAALLLHGRCGFTGVVQINDLDQAIFNLITGPLAATVNAGTFPVFLTKNVVMAESGHEGDGWKSSCILGYHEGTAFTSGSNLQMLFAILA